jgi:hypothetical protein
MKFGDREGDVCWRDGCQGVIAIADVEGCSCHISPPCSQCTEPREYCPICDWRAKDEDYRDYAIRVDLDTGMFFAPIKQHPLDPRKISYRIKPHTGASQICEGIYPDGTLQSDVLKLVEGTFGGHFEHFGNGKFKYIAYTD